MEGTRALVQLGANKGAGGQTPLDSAAQGGGHEETVYGAYPFSKYL
jgi:hypothetical protein